MLLILIIATTAALKAYLAGKTWKILNYLPAGALGYLILSEIFLFVFSLVLVFLATWFVYKNYTFSLTADAFKIDRGVFNKEEVAIPYRQIQNVNLRQGVLDQILGLSRIVVLTVGHAGGRLPDGKPGDGEVEFPPLDTKIAENLQNELLKRSQTQQVVVTS